MRPAEAGEACGYEVCRDGVPADAPSLNVTRPCAEGLYCNWDSGTCEPSYAEGDRCLTPEPGLPIPCEPDSYCSPVNGHCTAYLDLGDACVVEYDDAGVAEDPCAAPGRCGDDGVCARWPVPDYLPAGAACDRDARPDCQLGLACVAGVCAPLVCDGGAGHPANTRAAAPAWSATPTPSSASRRDRTATMPPATSRGRTAATPAPSATSPTPARPGCTSDGDSISSRPARSGCGRSRRRGAAGRAAAGCSRRCAARTAPRSPRRGRG
jgi:hypothetical protein